MQTTKIPIAKTTDLPGLPARRGAHLQNVRRVLEQWRFSIYHAAYTSTPFTLQVLLPDTTLATIASNAPCR